jgi:hypothetical protein
MMNGKPSTGGYRVPHEMNHNYVSIFNRALSYFDLSLTWYFFHTFLGTFSRAWERLHHVTHFCLICLQYFHLTAVDHLLRHANVWYCKEKMCLSLQNNQIIDNLAINIINNLAR